MIFLCWSPPSRQEQKACVDKSGVFNYDSKYLGATAKPALKIKQDRELSDKGFLVNHARVLVGSGLETFEKGKIALQNWRSAVASFSFGSGTLQGHLLTELLAGTHVAFLLDDLFSLHFWEERFSITMDEKNDVWYEILSFSKPANFLSLIGYPYVLLKQKHFARDSTLAMQKHLSDK
ncbi:UNVERIFIED_CONTAM: hypothetical protein Sangu_0126100 [Sesamum angustifolium]|uniref:DUF1990 domain-containing protein n=1 Tax=Sesamum angustifolium TaxID=2727405 RepID=A0AAW2RL96_9LAMI